MRASGVGAHAAQNAGLPARRPSDKTTADHRWRRSITRRMPDGQRACQTVGAPPAVTRFVRGDAEVMGVNAAAGWPTAPSLTRGLVRLLTPHLAGISTADAQLAAAAPQHGTEGAAARKTRCHPAPARGGSIRRRGGTASVGCSLLVFQLHTSVMRAQYALGGRSSGHQFADFVQELRKAQGTAARAIPCR
jgi:hypothetical protein